MARASDDNCRKLQNATGHNYDHPLSRICCLSTNGNFLFLEKRVLHFLPKMSTSPSIFLGHHPVPSQVFHFELVSGSLMIPSSHSMVKFKKYEKIEGGEESRLAVGARVARVVMWTRWQGWLGWRGIFKIVILCFITLNIF